MKNKSRGQERKILGVDLGQKKIGLAIGYVDGPIFGLDTVRVGDDDGIADLIMNVIKKEEVDKVVFGLPLSKDGKPTNQSRWVKEVGQEISKKGEVKVDHIDEYLTSWQSKEIDGEGDVDQQSAVLILKDYFNEK